MNDASKSAFIRCDYCHGEGFVRQSPHMLDAIAFGKCSRCNGIGQHYLNMSVNNAQTPVDIDLMLEFE